MSVPGILTGGKLKEIFLKGPAEPQTSYGVFGQNPGATPKIAKNTGRRDAENRDTMARLFIEIPGSAQADFLRSVPPESQELARVLMSGTGTGGSAGTGFFDFLLTNTQENFSEKAQIIDTLTDNYVLYFGGREPTMGMYNGVLLNTYQDDQRVWFLRAYSAILRGTQLAARNIIARLRYDSFLASGYLLNLNLGLDAETDISASRFAFQMVIKRLQVITPAVFSPTGLTPLGAAVPENDTLPDTGENLAYLNYDSREGVVTPEVPPTANDFPASMSSVDASVLAGLNYSANQVLNPTASPPQTLPPSNLDASIALGMNYSAASITGYPGTDPRQAAVLVQQEGRDRISEKVPSSIADSYTSTTLRLANANPSAALPSTSTTTEPAPLRRTPAVRTKGRAIEPVASAPTASEPITREPAPSPSIRSKSDDAFAQLDQAIASLPPGVTQMTRRTHRDSSGTSTETVYYGPK